MEPTNFSLVVICGPTGSGKSALGLNLAQTVGGEIVNYDSVQVYRGLDVGSAKIPLANRANVLHHLLDVVSPQEELTAGDFSRLARASLAEISSRGVVPILVGGTGFYLRSLLEGLSPAPGRDSDLRLRLAQLSQQQPAALHRYLRRADRSAAQRIHPNDYQKLIRAIEISSSSEREPRRPLTGFQTVKLGLNPPRADLYKNLDQRSAALFEAGGIVDETLALLKSGVPPQAKALQSLGYKQAVAVLEGRVTQAAAMLEVQTKTRQYAKRQMTWFRREADVHWLDGFGHQPEVQESARAHLAATYAAKTSQP